MQTVQSSTTYSPEFPSDALCDSGFSMLASASEQLKQLVESLYDSQTEEQQRLGNALAGTSQLVDIAQAMLFEASERDNKTKNTAGTDCRSA